MVSDPPAPSYSRPPVSEALIDIKVENLPDDIIPKLRKLHERFLPDFPIIITRVQVEGKITLKNAEFTHERPSGEILGFLFEKSDKKQIVQVKRNGFTFNQLKPDPRHPWPGWDILREEAKKGWNLFLVCHL